jgi:hypothetical protein
MRKIIWIIKNLSMFTIWNEIIFNFFTFEDVEYQQTPSYSVDDTTNCQSFPRLGNGVVHLLWTSFRQHTSSWLMSNLDACFIKIPNVIYRIIVLHLQSC